MATVNVIFGAVVPSRTLMGCQPSASENITSSGTSQQTTITAQTHDAAQITVTGGAVRVAFGPNPTAVAASILILDGQTREFGGLSNGDKCAVIDN